MIFLVACGNTHMEEMDDSHHMVMQGSGEVPEDLQVAKDPTYPVGNKAMSKADHMGEMMMGVEVEIVGAYETTAYITSFTPKGHPRIENHKWIIQEEIIDAGEEKLEPGAEVETTADHMMGMKGSTQEIIDSKETTVYMVDFTTVDGHEVTNHKWVIEEELEPIN
ncbi:YdhK family protein [Aquibacillus koreensis]|uniref:YdhK family protein n=2 Tax=Aquibacillus koreensis TaxID=279446 RepID=A0A9X3WMI4_9BACI|nr:YdhK family protein [Aquibacillus koreensis]MCT2536699.1 YdhK family protein [Aquibacillus koreensis]MDC3421545.1 YdhK family protein [Aquibacillus koreensis]